MRYHTHNGFFNFIHSVFGPHAKSLLKDWIKYNKIYIKCTLREKFLRFCQTHNIVPTHLHNIYNSEPVFHHPKIKTKFQHNIDMFIMKTLRLEINDTCRLTNYSRLRIFRLARGISNCLPFQTYNSFFRKQHVSLQSFYNTQHQNMNKKISWLLEKHNKFKHRQLLPIQYYYNIPDTHNSISSPSISAHSFSFSHTPTTSDLDTLSTNKINLDPQIFYNNLPSPSLTSIRDKWLSNLSSTDIPEDIQCFLQLGDNFSLPCNNYKNILFEFIKSIENNIKKLPDSTRSEIRNHSIPIINKLKSFSSHSASNSEFFKLISKTKEFLSNNPDLILTRADKGNTTVAMNRLDYKNKMTALLSDEDTYKKIAKDPIRQITSKSRLLLARWRDSDYISNVKYRTLYCSDGTLPRAYGLPKLHKVGNPLRIIISSIDSPLYDLASYLHTTISKSVPEANSHVSDSFQLVNKLSGAQLDDNFILISLDVVSLFTNIPIELAINSISNRWEYISKNCKIPKAEFLNAVRFVLESTYFKFDDITYKQNFGTPMGSPLSPIIADLVLQDLETEVLSALDFQVPFFLRYVDDIATAVPRDMVNFTLDKFNSFHPRLQFTIEIGNERLNFLDTTIILNEKTVEFDWYHKPTFSGRYLNFHSWHPVSQKRGVVICLVDRVFLLSHPKYHRKNLEFTVSILLENDYPLDFIFKIIRERLRCLFVGRSKKQLLDNTSEELKKISWFTVPYVPSISERFINIFRNSNSKTAFYSLNKLSRFIKVQKDTLPISSCKDVVYKISCRDCDASYVGQTGRQVKTRISEHRNHIRRNVSSQSVITDHRIECGHDFDWDGVKVLDHEKSYHKRLISEILYIKQQCNGLNLQSDTDFLHHAYLSIVDSL
ncbi:uncharacterized protein LOC120358632 [Solenopsis invicta]|uniref:uncharacterized protein LOC120358632 n=1 Tax=Solenopsis invicta TaxID=13686 RepID=UPI00193D14B5|nr:uncharacterized protein LOC120358632 [Solenopsis invicta]